MSTLYLVKYIFLAFSKAFNKDIESCLAYSINLFNKSVLLNNEILFQVGLYSLILPSTPNILHNSFKDTGNNLYESKNVQEYISFF